MLAVVSAGTVQAGASFRPTGAYTHAQCEALNRRRSVEAKQQDRVTQAIMCDTRPAACVTEMLYVHEFYWDRRKARASALGGSKCQLWRRDDDWPTVEPLLSRADTPTPEGLLTLLQLLPKLTRTPRRLRWVRTRYAYQPAALGTYWRHRAAFP